ncbi:MAG: NUDIX domain-containing protein, partial [Erysipelotrichaceae bacterium]|nr:NUDIX domain-containing protein [Erysipelotrichaceae bacterium]
MRLTTLCYIEKDGSYLMMHRTKKEQDENAGKWIGIGGHMKEDETPEECVRREIREETGLTVEDLKLRGILTFILPAWG